ncbi:MAG: mechanosensitive ion channel [Gammaproteobacteria bacterium]|nr:mechanosensitive ion channel [Gammaproteobacteria bacterium]MDH5802690.1 mechanosensitive ion channel [Gammaproteobacteria bacterium]
MKPEQARDWQELLLSTYEQLLSQLIVYTPKLLGAFLLLFIGGLIAYLLSKLARTGVKLLESLLIRLFPSFIVRSDIKYRQSYVEAISKIVFWFVLLFFIAASANSLGLDMVSKWVQQLLLYLPRLVVGLLIMIGGYLISNAIKLMVASAAESAGMKQALWIGRSAQFVVFFTAIVIGVEQLGINIQFFTELFIIVSAILLSGFSLAFAFGAKYLVANIIGAQQANKLFQLGDEIKIANIEGVLVEIKGTMLVIESQNERIMIPASLIMQRIGRVKSGSAN